MHADRALMTQARQNVAEANAVKQGSAMGYVITIFARPARIFSRSGCRFRVENAAITKIGRGLW